MKALELAAKNLKHLEDNKQRNCNIKEAQPQI